MMFGSIFYNCWAALFGFTIYFLIAIMNPFAMPLRTILISSIIAVGVFIIMFPIRYFISYILFTPEEVIFDGELDSADSAEEKAAEQPLPAQQPTSTVEFADESTEDIAQVVRTMMNKDDDAMLSRS